MKILVTGGAGFIGSNFARYLLAQENGFKVFNLDKLTYAGNLENLADIDSSPQFESRYAFLRADVVDAEGIPALRENRFDAIVNFAAETHVDRSIECAEPFLHTNVLGTHALLEACRRYRIERFLQISTDEVYGSAPEGLCFNEDAPLRPSSPYAASKAAADLLVLSYVRTYKLPAMILRCSNNYGPYQFPEKLIPLMIANALSDQPLPVYGDGMQIRDWLYVDDHCRGILAVLEKGRDGEIYNIGGNRSLPNLEVVGKVLTLSGKPKSLVRYVGDRPGHDRRYALSSEKLMRETGWRPVMDFEAGLARTIEWYRENAPWVGRVRSGEYRTYYERNYGNRTVPL